jgi:CubicO group peptidase (beta-lactamase class C family)
VLQPGAGADEDVSLEALMVRVGIPGLTIAVLEGGELVRDDVFGVESVETGEPVTSETLFEAASLSKPVFAYMVLRMVERGDLELDQPLHEILEYERFAGDPRALQLTPRLVLSHQTGLPNWGRDPLEFLAEPGERFGYSGEGYLYLQKCLEKMTGKTLDELARREVFGPLGMTRSRFSWTEEERPTRLAIGHDQAGTPRRRNPPEANAAGSLHTTAGDYARFLAALLAADGLEPETLRAAFEPAVRMTGDERGSPQAGKIAGKLGWGLGWGVQKAAPGGEPLRTLWHWGDNDTFLAFVALVPAAGSGVVYFTNSSNGLAVARQIVERFVGDMEPTFAWLGYAQSDDPGWAERRDGHVAERSGDYPTAVKHFTQALELDPDDEETARRVEWLGELIRVEKEPVQVSVELLELYGGSYGPRKLRQEGGKLMYQRDGRDPYQLIPLSEDTFALEGMANFRIRVDTDEKGRPVKLIGLYVNGSTDESPRDPG